MEQTEIIVNDYNRLENNSAMFPRRRDRVDVISVRLSRLRRFSPKRWRTIYSRKPPLTRHLSSRKLCSFLPFQRDRGPGEGRRQLVPFSMLPYLVSHEQLVYISTAASLAPKRRGSYPVCCLCTLNNVRLGRLYDARSTYGIFQVVERCRVRSVR